jgi:F-type H+-transporting ATPase subunit a
MHEEHSSWLAFLYGIQLGPFTIGSWHVGRFHLLPEWVPEAVPWAIVAALILAVLSFIGTRRMRRVPRGLQTVMEFVVTGFTNFAQSMMGEERGRDFAPFVGTLFIFIMVMNLIGLVPGMKSATANLNTTAALAIIVFLATQFYGMRTHGVLGYFKHMVADVLILPWYLAVFLIPFMLVLHLISEFVRPLSLAMRLFGNIMGKEVVLAILAGLATVTFALFGLHVAGFEVLGNYVSLNVPGAFGPPMLGLAAALVPLAILMGIIQALVFSLLASLYISLATETEAEHA